MSVGTGGFRTMPATGEPVADVKPGQTRNLATRLVSLSAPDAAGRPVPPIKGEKLQLRDVSEITDNVLVDSALRRLALDKAPQPVAQLVLWRLTTKLDWTTLARISRSWANAHEVTLARQFVDQLERGRGQIGEFDNGVLYAEVVANDPSLSSLAKDLSDVLSKNLILGLRPRMGVPAAPDRAAVTCRVQLTGTADKPEATVVVASSNEKGASWVPMGKFALDLANDKGETLKSPVVVDNLAEGLLGRLVRAQVTKGQKVKGKMTYKVRIDNASPLILNGLAVTGSKVEEQARVSALMGLNVSPRRSLTVPATADLVDRLGLLDGVRVVAADLSGL